MGPSGSKAEQKDLVTVELGRAGEAQLSLPDLGLPTAFLSLVDSLVSGNRGELPFGGC